MRNAEDGMDAKKILEKAAKSKKTKSPYTHTLDDDLMERFKKVIDKGMASQIIEELIKEFLESLDKEKK